MSFHQDALGPLGQSPTPERSLKVVNDGLGDETAAGRATRSLVDHLRADNTQVITATGLEDAEQIVASTSSLSCLLVDWDVHHQPVEDPGWGVTAATVTRTESLVRLVRKRNAAVPIFLLADRSTAEMVATDVLRIVTGYVWKLEDTPAFIASRIEEARHEYLEPLLPPFFGALVRFVQEGRYSWHTPGHSGGTAFLKTPVGSAFHEFFGESTLRSDLSVSVSELGSLLEHSGSVGAAEAEAARRFGGRCSSPTAPRRRTRSCFTRACARATSCLSIATVISRSCTRL